MTYGTPDLSAASDANAFERLQNESFSSYSELFSIWLSDIWYEGNFAD